MTRSSREVVESEHKGLDTLLLTIQEDEAVICKKQVSYANTTSLTTVGDKATRASQVIDVPAKGVLSNDE